MDGRPTGWRRWCRSWSGLGAFALGLAIGGTAPTMGVLVAGRLMQGLGGGAVVAVAYVCVGRGFPEELRPSVFAVMSTAWILPSLVSPLLASFVATAFGWRWVFLGLIPITAAIGLLASRSVTTLRPADARLDESPVDNSHIGEVLRLGLGAGLILAGLSTEVVWALLPLVAAGLLIAVPAFRSLTPRGTIRADRGLPAAVATRGVLTFSFFAADAFISLALTSVRGTATTYAGVVLAASSFTWTAGSWIQAREVRLMGGAPSRPTRWRLPGRRHGGPALSLSSAVPLWCWLVSSGVCGLGMGMAYSPLSVVTLAQAEPGREGEATSALQLTDVLGSALGTGVAGVIVSLVDRLGHEDGLALAIVFAMTAVAAGGRGGPRRTTRATSGDLVGAAARAVSS